MILNPPPPTYRGDFMNFSIFNYSKSIQTVRGIFASKSVPWQYGTLILQTKHLNLNFQTMIFLNSAKTAQKVLKNNHMLIRVTFFDCCSL